MKFNWKTMIVACVCLLGLCNVVNAKEILVILDSSASMSEKIHEGKTRMDAAREAFQKLAPVLSDSNHDVGLILFGHRLKADARTCCQDIETKIPIQKFSPATFQQAINQVTPMGKTPLAESLNVATNVLRKRSGDVEKAVIVLTDGIDTCNGDPVAVAKSMHGLGIQITFHVVGLSVSPAEAKVLKNIAAAGPGGTYHTATDTDSLTEILSVVVAPGCGGGAPEKPKVEYPELDRIGTILVGQLVDESAVVRISAAEKILERKIQGAVPSLIKSIQDELFYQGSEDAALNAIKALAPNEVEAALIGATKSKDQWCRDWAVRRVTKVGQSPKENRLNKVDCAIVARLTDELSVVRQNAANAIMERKTQAAVPALVKRVQDDVIYKSSKDAALAALKFFAPEKVEDALIVATKSKNQWVRKWATERLLED